MNLKIQYKNLYCFIRWVFSLFKNHRQLIFIMKLTSFYLLFCCMAVYGNVYSQKINISLERAKVGAVLKEIKRQSGFELFYNVELLERLPRQNVHLSNTSLANALTAITSPYALDFSIEGKTIIIFPKKGFSEQQRLIKGRVVNSKGVPIVGASIKKVKTTNGTSTDKDGLFELPDVEAADSISISMVGYTTLTMLPKSTFLEITLQDQIAAIDEVVVVGFGTQKKGNLVGAMTTIKPSELKTSSSNLTTALQGRIAGVIAYQGSGEPGQDNASFFIRGAASFGYKTDPLILIDGLELNTTDLARLQPNDIESFSILKDATAAAVYGARGANGVILVTTKRGKEGKAILNFQFDHNISSPTRNLELADPITYMIKANEAASNMGASELLPYYQSEIDARKAGGDQNLYPTNDWRKMLMKNNTRNSKANLSVRGGGKVATYFVTASMNNDNGILKVDKRNNFNNNIKLNSFSLRSNTDIRLSSSTDLAVRMYGNFDDYTGPMNGGSAVYKSIINSNPVRFPAYYKPDEANEFTEHILFGNYRPGGAEGTLYTNPYADMVKGYQDYSRSLLLAQMELKQDLSEFLLKGLKFRLMASTQRRSFFSLNRQYSPYFYAVSQGALANGVYQLEEINKGQGDNTLSFAQGPRTVETSSYGEMALNYDRVFGQKHNVSALLVGIARNRLTSSDLIEDTNEKMTLQSSLPYRNLGISGRASYSYDSRYMAEFNFGFNGSERFHQDKRYGFFPSAGVAWNVANEKFWAPLAGTIKQLKLRASYGFIGNDAIGGPTDRFFYLSDVSLSDPGKGAVFGENFQEFQPGVTVKRYDNALITWERSKRLNLGMDLNIKDFTIIADYSTDKRTNILMDRSFIPSTMGLATGVRANVGEATSEAFEASVDYNKGFSSGYWLGLRANFTYATNRYLAYEEPEYPVGQEYRSVIGNPLSQGYGLIAERLFVDEEDIRNSPKQTFGDYVPGDIKYRDVSGDGQITDADKVPLGFPQSPEISVGFGFSMGYKGFDFSSFFSGLGRRSFWIDYGETSPFINDQRAFLKAYADNHWSEDNQNLYALWPRLSSKVIANNEQRSTWFMRDGSFLRLKQLEIGYTFPEHLLSKLKISKFRVFAIGNNLMTFSKFKLWDIELGGNAFNYPIQRVYNFGVNVTF